MITTWLADLVPLMWPCSVGPCLCWWALKRSGSRLSIHLWGGRPESNLSCLRGSESWSNFRPCKPVV